MDRALDHREAAARLVEACRRGALDDVLERLGVEVLTVFGSAARSGDVPARDIDVGALAARGRRLDVVSLAEAVAAAAGPAEVDVVDLRRAPVTLRATALTACLPLYEAWAGAFAEAQMAATLERWDTDWLRQLDLRALAGSA